MAFETPAVVVTDAEFSEGFVELCDGRKEAQPQELLFESANEAFGATVAFRRSKWQAIFRAIFRSLMSAA